MKRFSLFHDPRKLVNFLIALSLGIVVSSFIFHTLGYPLIGIDDANIYFVYARNLANGYGFVYNAGGERVEGFTSLLWTLLSALVFKLFRSPEFVLLTLNIVLISAGIAYAVAYLQDALLKEGEKPEHVWIWSILFIVLIITSPRYLVWNTLSLMENALWSTLLLVTTIFVIRDHVSIRETNLGFIPLAILLLITRPESFLWVTVFTTILFLRLYLQSDLLHACKSLAPSILAIGLTLIVLTMFRLDYFGYPLPNTYYAKVSPKLLYNIQQGAGYLITYLMSDLLAVLCFFAVLTGMFHATSLLFSRYRPLSGMVFLPFIACIGFLPPLLVGGDHFGSFRVYQNIYPIEMLTLFIYMYRVRDDYVKNAGRSVVTLRVFQRFLVVLAIGIIQNQAFIWRLIDSEIGIEFKVADYGRKSGSYIEEILSPLPRLPSLGVVTSGGIKYSYNGDVIDLMGLNNTTMAHNRGDRVGTKDHAAFDIDTFYQLRPDIVWPLTVKDGQWQYDELQIKESWENTIGFKGLFDEPMFQQLYTYSRVSSVSDEKYAIVGWFRKDFLNVLKASGDVRVEQYEYGIPQSLTE